MTGFPTTTLHYTRYNWTSSLRLENSGRAFVAVTVRINFLNENAPSIECHSEWLLFPLICSRNRARRRIQGNILANHGTEWIWMLRIFHKRDSKKYIKSFDISWRKRIERTANANVDCIIRRMNSTLSVGTYRRMRTVKICEIQTN